MKQRHWILALTCLFTPLCLAQDNSGGISSEPRPPKPAKTTVYDFSDVDILGKLKSPEGKAIVEPPEFKFKRLLDLDESFIPNILRSVDDY